MTNRRPNIVFCTCDQLRAFETGCYGNPVIRTPHMDRIAAEGVRFEHGVSTFPVCMAARSVMLSGQYNRSCTGGVGNIAMRRPDGGNCFPQYPEHGRPHLREQTLPEALQAAGYYTAALGKWHIHSWPQDIGFDYYLIPRMNHCHSGQSFTENGGIEFVPPGYSVDYECDRLEELLKNRAKADEPFFLFYNISPPHCPVADAPQHYLDMYDPAAIPLRPNVDPNKPLQDHENSLKVYRWDFRYYNHRLPETMTLPEGYGVRELTAEYYGLTTWADDAIGRMLRALDANGLTENTIVIFTADHGDNLGSHTLVQKGGPNEESIRVPWLMRWPDGLPQDAVVTEQVAGLVDIAPTLLSLADVPVPDHFHGIDLAAVAKGNKAVTDRPYAIVETGGGVGLRAPDLLYYVPFEQGERRLADSPSQCFDLVNDPYEFKNLADTGTSLPDGVQKLDAQLRNWDASTPWMEGGWGGWR